MKKLVLVHGWGGNSDYFKDLINKLKGKNIEVKTFNMPDIDNPQIEEWVGFLQEKIKDVDEETYFIGHSIGCQTIMRFLEKLDKTVAGCIFIAGWINLIGLGDDEKPIAKPWLETPIDFYKVKNNVNKIVAIFSDDDPFVPLSDKNIFEDKLNAKTIVLHGKGHIDDINEVIEEIKDFIK